MLKRFCYPLILFSSLIVNNVVLAQHEHSFNATLESEKTPHWQTQEIHYKSDVPQNIDLLISLDQQQYPSLKPLIQQFAQQHNIHISVSDGTCGISAGLLSRKQADIGGYCCPPGAGDRLPGLRFHTLGIAAIALITHPDNPTDNVSFAQAKQLFSGEIENWNELPHITSAQNVQAISRLHCKKRPGHWKLLLEDENFFSPMAIDMGAIPDVISQTHRNLGAISYETLMMIERYKKDEGDVKILHINGAAPDNLQALAAGRYPLYLTYNITTWEGAAQKPLADKLVAYLIQIMEKEGKQQNLLSAKALRAAGWIFKRDELIAAPASHHSNL